MYLNAGFTYFRHWCSDTVTIYPVGSPINVFYYGINILSAEISVNVEKVCSPMPTLVYLRSAYQFITVYSVFALGFERTGSLGPHYFVKVGSF